MLASLRRGEPLDRETIASVVEGAVSGDWSDAQLAAFLMGVACRGLGLEETIWLTRAMLESGERWELRQAVPGLADKHSTGGVGDKITLVLGPLLAEAGVPMAMLTGRGLGHTGGTADKLESIPGLRQDLDRSGALRLLESVGLALGVASERIAPADRRLYALRDHTATVDSLPLIVSSILSKKLALGAEAIVFDVKVGTGAFLADIDSARRLARTLVDVAAHSGLRAVAWLTDMNQPLGDWVGHHAEVREALEVLEGRGPRETRELTLTLACELLRLLRGSEARAELETLLDSGRARERLLRWAAAQGGDPHWLRDPRLPLAPVEIPLRAATSGYLSGVDVRRVGLLLIEAGAGRLRPGDSIDREVALRYSARLGSRLEAGEELGRVYLRREDRELATRLENCFTVSEQRSPAPPLLLERLEASTAGSTPASP